MERLLSVIAGLSLLLMAMVLFNIRRAHVRVEYSVSWLAAAALLLALSQWEWGLMSFAHLMGMNDPPVVMLLIVGSVFVAVFFRFSVVMSDLKDANIALTQKVAVLEYQLNCLHEKLETTTDGN
ncbi:MAG: DUF2304 domain-containing protein [Acidobacteria bacterium]|nr:DUF2304 domain-containing protein [Acidobacteriota bacterium]